MLVEGEPRAGPPGPPAAPPKRLEVRSLAFSTAALFRLPKPPGRCLKYPYSGLEIIPGWWPPSVDPYYYSQSPLASPASSRPDPNSNILSHFLASSKSKLQRLVTPAAPFFRGWFPRPCPPAVQRRLSNGTCFFLTSPCPFPLFHPCCVSTEKYLQFQKAELGLFGGIMRTPSPEDRISVRTLEREML